MPEILFCILVTTCIGIGFKLFTRFKVHTFNAIVINYTVCLILGSLIDPDAGLPFNNDVIQSGWFYFDLSLGLLFITGFYLTATAIQRSGITMTTLMQRMSLILTVTFTVLFFHEHFGWLEASGIVLAVAAILAINQSPGAVSFGFSKPFPVILLLVWLLAATIEILLFYVEKSGVVGHQQMAFTTHGFGSAAIFGWLSLGILALRGQWSLTGRDVVAGICLGIPNYFSIYLLLRMLNQGWNGSIMYPMVNLSVLLLSTFIAVVFFKEKLSKVNWIGILLASLSITVIGFAHTFAP